MKNGICKLNNYRVIEVSGEDAAKFLHGQLTVDTENSKDGEIKLTAHCDFKGKMWSIAYLCKRGAGFSLLIENAAAEQTLAQLKKYGVFSKVSIDINEDVVLVSFAGEEIKSTIEKSYATLPTTHLASIEVDGSLFFCISQSTPRYMGLISQDSFIQLENEASVTFIDEQFHEWLEVNDGFGIVTESTVNEYVPQMFNLQCLGGIDFDKGCYMGQEVIARTKFLGKNKRALYLLHMIENNQTSESASKETLEIGTTLERQVGDNWRRAGNVIRVSTHNNEMKCLAVLPNDIVEGDTLRSKDQPLRQMTVQPLPYKVDTD